MNNTTSACDGSGVRLDVGFMLVYILSSMELFANIDLYVNCHVCKLDADGVHIFISYLHLKFIISRSNEELNLNLLVNYHIPLLAIHTSTRSLFILRIWIFPLSVHLDYLNEYIINKLTFCEYLT